MAGRLDGKVAVITGAAQGMGESHATRFVAEGARVVLTDVQSDAVRDVAARHGDAAVSVSHDVSDPASWDRVVRVAQERFGGADILVNNAGRTGPVAGFLDLDAEDYLRTIAVDQHAMFFGIRAIAPAMIARGGGSIINISSVAGLLVGGTSPNVGYTAAKFAVRGITKHAAIDLGPRGIRVNCVLPGGVDTPLALAVRASRTDEENARNVPPIGRSGMVEDISNLVVFLASDESAFISGADLVADGARSA